MNATTSKYTNWFVLNVGMGREHIIKDFIAKQMKKSDVKVFSKEMIFKRKGKSFKVKKTLFPGYVFIKNDIDIIINEVREKLKTEYISAVCFKKIKCEACYTKNSPCMVRPDEMKLLLNTLNSDGVLSISFGHKKNDEFVITDGPLANLKGNILFLNEKKKSAGIEISIFKRKMKITVGFEMIKESCLN